MGWVGALVCLDITLPDSLVGSFLGSGLLLSSIPGATAAELTRLQPQVIVILGGTGVVSGRVAPWPMSGMCR